MSRKSIYWFVAVFTVITTLGCAMTTVRKNPGNHDRGVRFYRPKPYLLLEPAVTDNTLQYNAVKISLDWLPDYSEEYSIHVRAGIGANKTNITLENGWNLTKLSATVDSKTSENITAFASLAKALVPFLPTGTDPSINRAVTESPQVLASNVPARNVPLGYYEAVIASAPDGCKRLYGWRYIGFSPYTPCPTCPSGVLAEDCAERQVYGLVAEDGVMVFKLLDEIANAIIDTRPVAAVPASQEELYDAVANNVATLSSKFSIALGLTSPTAPGAPEVAFEVNGNKVTFNVKRKDSTTLKDDYLTKVWQVQLESALRGISALKGKLVVVEIKHLPR